MTHKTPVRVCVWSEILRQCTKLVNNDRDNRKAPIPIYTDPTALHRARVELRTARVQETATRLVRQTLYSAWRDIVQNFTTLTARHYTTEVIDKWWFRIT